MLSPVDPQFFSRLGQDVKTELKREKELERKADERQQPVHTHNIMLNNIMLLVHLTQGII